MAAAGLPFSQESWGYMRGFSVCQNMVGLILNLIGKPVLLWLLLEQVGMGDLGGLGRDLICSFLFFSKQLEAKTATI